MLTQTYLRHLLDYDAATGVFVWKPRDTNPQWTGKHAGKTCGRLNAVGYVDISINGRRHGAHRLAWLFTHGVMPKEIDHINGVKTDNRLSNLRSCTRAENCQNQTIRSTNTSGFTGVSWHKSEGRWCANITINGKHKSLGLYDTKIEAYQAYITAKHKFHTFNPTVRG